MTRILFCFNLILFGGCVGDSSVVTKYASCYDPESHSAFVATQNRLLTFDGTTGDVEFALSAVPWNGRPRILQKASGLSNIYFLLVEESESASPSANTSQLGRTSLDCFSYDKQNKRMLEYRNLKQKNIECFRCFDNSQVLFLRSRQPTSNDNCESAICQLESGKLLLSEVTDLPFIKIETTSSEMCLEYVVVALCTSVQCGVVLDSYTGDPVSIIDAKCESRLLTLERLDSPKRPYPSLVDYAVDLSDDSRFLAVVTRSCVLESDMPESVGPGSKEFLTIKIWSLNEHSLLFSTTLASTKEALKVECLHVANGVFVFSCNKNLYIVDANQTDPSLITVANERIKNSKSMTLLRVKNSDSTVGCVFDGKSFELISVQKRSD